MTLLVTKCFLYWQLLFKKIWFFCFQKCRNLWFFPSSQSPRYGWFYENQQFHFLPIIKHLKVKLSLFHGIEVYNGSGKTVGNHPNGYPPRSHNCMPAETHFAKVFHHAQNHLVEKETRNSWSRSMVMWKNSLVHTWENWPLPAGRNSKAYRSTAIDHGKIIELEGARMEY